MAFNLPIFDPSKLFEVSFQRASKVGSLKDFGIAVSYHTSMEIQIMVFIDSLKTKF